MASLDPRIRKALWAQFKALIPVYVETHPYGGHRRRIADRIIFNKLADILLNGGSYEDYGDDQASATTIRRRRDEWIAAGIFDELERICIEVFDQTIGLDLADLSVDGCIAKCINGGELSGPSPVDRRKGGTKRSIVIDGNGIPLGFVLAPANVNDSPLLHPTLDTLNRLDLDFPAKVTIHLDAGYDSYKTRNLLDELGYEYVISKKGVSLQAGRRWTVERTHSWQNDFKKIWINTERRAINFEGFFRFVNAIIVIRRLIRLGWTLYRWESRPTKWPRKWGRSLKQRT